MDVGISNKRKYPPNLFEFTAFIYRMRISGYSDSGYQEPDTLFRIFLCYNKNQELIYISYYKYIGKRTLLPGQSFRGLRITILMVGRSYCDEPKF